MIISTYHDLKSYRNGRRTCSTLRKFETKLRSVSRLTSVAVITKQVGDRDYTIIYAGSGNYVM